MSEYYSPRLTELNEHLVQNQQSYNAALIRGLTFYEMALYPFLNRKTNEEIQKETERLRILNNDFIDPHHEHVMD